MIKLNSVKKDIWDLRELNRRFDDFESPGPKWATGGVFGHLVQGLCRILPKYQQLIFKSVLGKNIY
jgi:hypothetical protein